MSPKSAVISWSVALLLAVCSTLLYLENKELEEELQAEAIARAEREQLADRLRASEENVARLREQLEQARSREREVLALQEAAAEAETSATDPSGAETHLAGEGALREAVVLESLDDADPLLKEFLAKGDVEGLWLLAADLLSMDEEGYEKLIALFRSLEANEEAMESFMNPFEALWREPELLVGRFLRDVSEHSGDLLRFNLYLDSKTEEELPKSLRNVREELARELEGVFLGYYGGDDPELLDGYVERYREGLSGNPAADRRVKGMISGLSQIPTQESAAVLVDLLPRAPAELQEDIVRALAWQRSEQALPALRSLLQSTNNPDLVKVVRAAIRLVE